VIFVMLSMMVSSISGWLVVVSVYVLFMSLVIIVLVVRFGIGMSMLFFGGCCSW